MNALAKDHDESLSPRLKIAAFMQLLPNDIQDTAFQSTGTAVCNRLAVNSGPAPMDVGFVQEEEEYWPEAEDDSWMLGAVGKGTMCCACDSCTSHFAPPAVAAACDVSRTPNATFVRHATSRNTRTAPCNTCSSSMWSGGACDACNM